MKWYSDHPGRRASQIVADVVAVLAVVAFVVAGVLVHAAIATLATIGTGLASTGSGFQEWAQQLGDALASVPILGGSVAAPLEGAGGVGGDLVATGNAVAAAIGSIATGAGVAVAVLPSLAVLVGWLVPRLRGARRAGLVAALVRAHGTLTPDDLVALELRRAGVRARAPRRF